MSSKRVGQRPTGCQAGEKEVHSSSNGFVQCAPVKLPGLTSLVHERRLQKVLQKVQGGSHHLVRDLAREVHLSPAHLQRLFKQETGLNLKDFLSENRLGAAARLLSNTDMEVKEIAYLTGYHHHSSFVRAFKRRFHQPPREFRRPPAA
jgi:transcriptional regulator GlxA family with amidase domain